MASGAEGIILQPLWKIHNIDWSDRRNVFETEPSRPTLDLLRRGSHFFSRYEDALYRDYGKQLSYSGYRPLFVRKWPRLTDTGRTTA
nr:hypothetical protein BaRGS_012807 [Batillaria attramentaria]